MIQAKRKLTLQEFLALPETGVTYEFIDGQTVPKMSPKLFHYLVQLALVNLLKEWHQGKGIACQEWAVILKRQGKDWVPIPDVLYISVEA